MIGAKLCCMLTNALSFSYDLEARTMYALALTLKNAEISLDVPPTAHSIANALQTVLPTDVADGSLPDFAFVREGQAVIGWEAAMKFGPTDYLTAQASVVAGDGIVNSVSSGNVRTVNIILSIMFFFFVPLAS